MAQVNFYMSELQKKQLFKFNCDLTKLSPRDVNILLRIENAACHAIYSKIYRKTLLDISIYDYCLEERLSKKIKRILIEHNIDYSIDKYWCGLQVFTNLKFGYLIENYKISIKYNHNSNKPFPHELTKLLNI